MRLVILIFMAVVLFLDISLKKFITISCTIVWIIYTIYYFVMLLNESDKKISTKEVISNIPNESLPELVRYFYKKKIDNRVFISIVFDMLMKNYISLVKDGDEYYFVNVENQEVFLTKSEEAVKKILFREIGNSENVALSAIIKSSKKNSAYLYDEVQIFKSTFENECAKEKYFKSNKNIFNNSLFYLVFSLILSFYNLFFVKSVYLFILIFSVTATISIIVSNFKKIEDDRLSEYCEWLKFKNYIINKNLSSLNVETLEKYILYAYVLDCYNEFKTSVLLKYYEDKECFRDSLILRMVSSDIFDEIETKLNKSLNNIRINTILLFKRNKGRRN